MFGVSVLKVKSAFYGLVVAAALAVPAPVWAADEAHSRQLVQQVGDDLVGLLEGDSARQRVELRELLVRAGDMRQVAGFALGRYARMMPKARRGEYADLFIDYIAGVYSRQFSEYSGQRMQVVSAVDLGKKGVMVRSTVGGEGNPIAVD